MAKQILNLGSSVNDGTVIHVPLIKLMITLMSCIP